MTKARTTPGHSVSRRLAGRSHTRASVGPRSDFFHRLGMQDPFALSASDERSDRARSDLSTGNPFVFLSSAAYFEEVEASRYRLLQRLQASRETERLGERLERVGPVAVGVRPADSVLFGGMSILRMPAEEVEEAELAEGAAGASKPRYAPWPERHPAAKRTPLARVRPQAGTRAPFERAPRQVASRAPFERAPRQVASRVPFERAPRQVASRVPFEREPRQSASGRRPVHHERRAPPPMSRAYGRTPQAAVSSRLARAVQEIAAGLGGPVRDQLIDIVDTVNESPTRARVDAARRALRSLRGVDGAKAREALLATLPDAAERPIAHARGRQSAPGQAPDRGLRRVLASSPALTIVEAPTRASEVEAAPDSSVGAPPAPAARRAAPATVERALPGSKARARQVGGAPPSRRPSARVVSRGILSERAERSELSRGPASPRRAPTASSAPALERAARRSASGVVQPYARAPLAGAATSWVRPVEVDAEARLDRDDHVPQEAPRSRERRAPVRGAPRTARPVRHDTLEATRGAASATARLLGRDVRSAPTISGSPVVPRVLGAAPAALLGRGSPPVDRPGALASAGAAPGAFEERRQPPALRALARGVAALDRAEDAPALQRLSASPVRFARTLEPLSIVLPRPLEPESPEGVDELPASRAAAAPSARPAKPARGAEPSRGAAPSQRSGAVQAPRPDPRTRARLPRALRERSATAPAWRASRRAAAPVRTDGSGRSRLRSSPTAHVSAPRPVAPLAAGARVPVGSVARAAARSLTLPRVSETGERLLAPMLPTVLVAARKLVEEVERVAAQASQATERRASGAPSRPLGGTREREKVLEQATSAPSVGPMLRAAARSVEGESIARPSRAPLSRSPLTWLEPRAADAVVEGAPSATSPAAGDTAVVRAGRAGAVPTRRPSATTATERAEQRDAPAVRLDRSGRALLAPVALSHLAPQTSSDSTSVEASPEARKPRRSPTPREAPVARTRAGRGSLAPSARPLARSGAAARDELPRSLVPRAAAEGDLSLLLPTPRRVGRVLQGADLVLPEREEEESAPQAHAHRMDVAAAISAALRTQRSIVQVDAVRRATTEVVPDGAEVIEAFVRAVGDRMRVRERRPTTAARVWLTEARLPDLAGDALGQADEPAARASAPGRSRPSAWAETRGEPLATDDVPAARVARRWAEPGAAPMLPTAATARQAAGEPASPPVEAPIRFRATRVGLGPMTLASFPGGAEVPSVDEAPERPGSLRGTLSRLASDDTDAPRTQAAERRLRRARATNADAGSLLRGAAPESPSEVTDAAPADARTRARRRRTGVSMSPGWARRAGGDGLDVPARELPLREARVQTMGRLLGALARSGDPEEIVKVVLESSDSLERAAADLPGATRAMVERLVRSAGDRARSGTRATRLQAAQAQVLSQKSSTVGPSSAGGSEPPSGGGGGEVGPATGASGVMRLAGKLMKLIHLAEKERKAAEAERQVRMSEETGSSRAESGAGQAGGENDDKKMNIKALRQDVLEAVLRELENIRWRREDPDGPSIWC